MTITVISKHLYSIFNHSSRKNWNDWLEICHVVESARYHYDRTCFIAENALQMPLDFEPGLEISRDEGDRYYRFMAIWIEIEAFYKSSKQFLDLCWCLFGNKFTNGAEKISFLNEAMHNMKRKVKSSIERDRIKIHPYFTALEDAWKKWGHEVAACRNFVEHHHPLGGQGQSYAVSLTNDKEIIDIFLPDKFPEYTEDKSKTRLTYKKQIKARAKMEEVIMQINDLISKLIGIKIVI